MMGENEPNWKKVEKDASDIFQGDSHPGHNDNKTEAVGESEISTIEASDSKTIIADEGLENSNSEVSRFDSKNLLLILLILVLVLVVVLAAFIFLPHNTTSSTSDKNASDEQAATSESGSVDDSSEGSSYDNNGLNNEGETGNSVDETETSTDSIETLIEDEKNGGATWHDFTNIKGSYSGFFGVWCYASTIKQEAISVAQDMANYGISGQVFYSENWSKLAGDRCFYVSAGSYDSIVQANAALSDVNKYFPNALVEYSGEFIENPQDTVGDNNSGSDYHIENMIKLAITRELTEADLVGCSSFELAAIRNGIYATYGYVFQSAEWNEYYSRFSWYEPNPSFQQGDVSPLESKNAATIKAYEEKTYGGVYTF